MMKRTLESTGRYLYFSFSTRYLQKLCIIDWKPFLTKIISLQHSTQHAILDIVNTIHFIQNKMDLKLFTCGVFVELRKAFATVDHSILHEKRNQYGINWGEPLLIGFAACLLDRSQGTKVSSKQSLIDKISYWVRQYAPYYSWSLW